VIIPGNSADGCLEENRPMMDDMEVRVQDLAIDEIRELLLEAGAEITHEQAEHLAAFIAEVGSCAEALEILSQLSGQRDAA
jgi:hypothetical protein